MDAEPSLLSDAAFSRVHAAAKQLYGLVHQRFIVTRAGLEQMVCPLGPAFLPPRRG
jgi:hypothetical protein